MFWVLLLLTAGPTLEGSFRPLHGQWPPGQVRIAGELLVIQGRHHVFVVEHGIVRKIPFNGFPSCVFLMDGRLAIASSEETAVVDLASGERLAKTEALSYLETDGDRIFAMGYGRPDHAYPDMLRELDPVSYAFTESLFKQPLLEKRPTRFWVVRHRDDLFIALDTVPNAIFLSTEATRKQDREISRHIQGISFRQDLWEAPEKKPLVLTLAKDRPQQWIQEYLADPPHVTFFGALGNGYLHVTEIGVRVPNLNKEIYIGSRLILTILDRSLTIRDQFIADGQFAGLEGTDLVLLHDREKTRPPLQVYASLTGSPEERARHMLEAFQNYGLDTLTPLLERIDLSEVAPIEH